MLQFASHRLQAAGVLPQQQRCSPWQRQRRHGGRALLVRPPQAVEELVGEASTSGAEQQHEGGPSSSGSSNGSTGGKRLAVLKAAKFAAVPVEEAGRPLSAQHSPVTTSTVIVLLGVLVIRERGG